MLLTMKLNLYFISTLFYEFDFNVIKTSKNKTPSLSAFYIKTVRFMNRYVKSLSKDKYFDFGFISNCNETYSFGSNIYTGPIYKVSLVMLQTTICVSLYFYPFFKINGCSVWLYSFSGWLTFSKND